jgi:hypothetical protein
LDKYWVFCDLIYGSIAFKGNKAEIFFTLFFTPLFENFLFKRKYHLLFLRRQEGFVTEIFLWYNFKCIMHSIFCKDSGLESGNDCQ